MSEEILNQIQRAVDVPTKQSIDVSYRAIKLELKQKQLELLDEVDNEFFKVFMTYHEGDNVELLNLGKRTIKAIKQRIENV